MDYILFDKVDYFNAGIVNRIKTVVDSLEHEPALLNDALYCNFSEVSQYYDDCFEKTANFLDYLSLADTQENFTRRT